MSSELHELPEGLLVVLETSREILSVVGKDAQSWLNGLVSCDLTTLDRRRGAYGLLLTKQGKIQSDVEVVVGESGLFLAVAPGLAEGLAGTLDRHLVMEDAEIERRPGLGSLRLLGAHAAEVAASLLGAGGATLAVGAIDWLGFGGALVVAPHEELAAVAQQAISLAGGAARRASPSEWDAMRIRRSFPLFGVDYGAEDNPHEASLEQLAVSFNKGCYLGQEVVCMQDMRGKVKRRIAALKVAGPVAAGAQVFAKGGEQPIGDVTSVATVGSDVLALARLRAPFFEGSPSLTVAGTPAELLPSRGG